MKYSKTQLAVMEAATLSYISSLKAIGFSDLEVASAAAATAAKFFALNGNSLEEQVVLFSHAAMTVKK